MDGTSGLFRPFFCSFAVCEGFKLSAFLFFIDEHIQ